MQSLLLKRHNAQWRYLRRIAHHSARVVISAKKIDVRANERSIALLNLLDRPRATRSEKRVIRGQSATAGVADQNRCLNRKYSDPDSTMAAGKVSTQAMSRLRTVDHCNPD